MKSVTKSKFLAFFAVIALFSAVIFAGGCDGSSSSSADEGEHYSEEELAMQEWDKQQAELPDETTEKDIVSTAKSLIDDLDLEETEEEQEEETPENSGGALLLNAANNSAPLLGAADNGGLQSNGREIIESGYFRTGNIHYPRIPYESYYIDVTEDESKYPIITDHDPKKTSTFTLKVTELGGKATAYDYSYYEFGKIPDDFVSKFCDGKLNDTDILIININKSIASMGKNAFKGLNKLQMVIVRGEPLNTNRDTIGESAFENCSKLWYAGGFGKSWKSIKLGNRAFANCATNSPDTDNTLYFDCGLASELADEYCEAPFEGTKRIIGVAQTRTLAGLSAIDRINKEIRLRSHGKVVKPWGCDLSDNALICDLSIPGTHDSATYKCENTNGDFGGYARTQGLSLSGQWKRGVRFFDLRVTHPVKNDRSQMKIKHGDATCYRLDASGKKVVLTLHDAIKEIADEVYQSGDFAIIQITHQNEKGDECKSSDKDRNDYDLGDKAIQAELAKWKKTEGDYKNVAADYELGVTTAFEGYGTTRVKDLRGKILFIHNVPNQRDSNDNIPVTGCWGSGLEVISKLDELVKVKNIEKFYFNDEERKIIMNRVYMQNFAHANAEEKLKAVRAFFEEYPKYKAGTELVRKLAWGFNYTSGYRQNFWLDGVAFPNYPVVAEGVNGEVADIINGMSAGTPIGFTIMDYAGFGQATKPGNSVTYYVNGNKLLDAVINHNFK